MASIRENEIQASPLNFWDTETSVDSFGRGRVATPTTIFDSKQIHDNQPLIWDDQEVSGSGTSSTYNTNQASTSLGVALNTAGKRVRQTRRRFNYEPGKSQLILMTSKMTAGGTGITAAVGPFDDENGLFFTNDTGTLKAVRRTYVTGAAVDNEVTQANWSHDSFDGSGPSGITIDPTKVQILWFSYEWLGVGSAYCGFVVDGAFLVAHRFDAANTLDKVWASTPNFPLRYELENDGTGAATTIDHICSTVISEGGTTDTGVLRYASTNGTHVDCNTDNTTYAIIGIRLKSTHLDESVIIEKVNIMIETSSEQGEWNIILNPSVASTFTYSDETNSAVQIARGAAANTVTGGTKMDGGYAFSSSGGGGRGEAGETVENALRLGSLIDGTPDEMVLTWTPRGGTTNHDIEGSIHWRELT